MGKMQERHGVADGDTSGHPCAGGTPGKKPRTAGLPAKPAAALDESVDDKAKDEVSPRHLTGDPFIDNGGACAPGERSDNCYLDAGQESRLNQVIMAELLMMYMRFKSALDDVKLDKILEQIHDAQIMNGFLDFLFLGVGVGLKGPLVHFLASRQAFKGVSHEFLDSAFEAGWENLRFQAHHASRSSKGPIDDLREILDGFEAHAQDAIRAVLAHVGRMDHAQKEAFLDAIRDESVAGKGVFMNKIHGSLADLKTVSNRIGNLGTVRPIYGGIQLGVLRYAVVGGTRYMINLRSYGADNPAMSLNGERAAGRDTTMETLQFDMLVPTQFQVVMHDRYAEVRGPQPMGEVMDFDHGYPRPPWFDNMYQVVKGVRSRGEIARYATPEAKSKGVLPADDMFAGILPPTRPNDEGETQ